MTSASTISKIENLPAGGFFFCLFIYQIAFTFQGVDLADEGFYATFYSQVFTNPETVQFNFMFWLSGIIGGAWAYLFDFLGLWGFRLAGVLFTTATIVLAYHILKNHLEKKYLLTSLGLITLLLSNDPKALYYNNLSAFFYIVTALFLFHGLKENNLWKLFLSGCFVALNIFTRLPNILGIGIAVIILYKSYLYRESLKDCLKKTLSFIAGLSTTIIAVFSFMKIIGHYDLFINSVKLVIGLGKGDLQKKGEGSSYGIGALIKLFLANYENCLKYIIYIIAFLLVTVLLIKYLKQTSIYRHWHAKALAVISMLLFIGLILAGKLDHIEMMYCFTGLTIITSLFILAEKDRDMKILTLTGVFILFVQPLGSSGGMHAVGQYSMWLIFPVVFNYLFSIKSLKNILSLARRKTVPSLQFVLTEPQFNQIKKYGLITAIVGCLFHAYYYPYFDKQERLKMVYPINNDRLACIFTGEKRASMINELLEVSKKYITAGDYTLAYECIPMFHYLTRTKPYIKNSWPYLYMADVFKRELWQAYNETQLLPVVIVQKINTIGDASNWPAPGSLYDEEWKRKNEERNLYLNDFLVAHNYKEAWNNACFKIMIPPAKSSL